MDETQADELILAGQIYDHAEPSAFVRDRGDMQQGI